MSIPSLSYTEHAMIYSAALLVIGRFLLRSAPVVSVTLCESMYRPLVVYCTGLCLLRKPYYTTKLFSPVSGGQINNHTQ